MKYLRDVNVNFVPLIEHIYIVTSLAGFCIDANYRIIKNLFHEHFDIHHDSIIHPLSRWLSLYQFDLFLTLEVMEVKMLLFVSFFFFIGFSK